MCCAHEAFVPHQSTSCLRVSPASLPLVSTSGCSQTCPDQTPPFVPSCGSCSGPGPIPPGQSHATPCCYLGLISDDCIELGLGEGSHLLTSAFLPFSAPPLWSLASPPQYPLPFLDQHLWHCGSLAASIHSNMSGPILAQMRRDMLMFLLESHRRVVPMISPGHPTFYLC